MRTITGALSLLMAAAAFPPEPADGKLLPTPDSPPSFQGGISWDAREAPGRRPPLGHHDPGVHDFEAYPPWGDLPCRDDWRWSLNDHGCHWGCWERHRWPCHHGWRVGVGYTSFALTFGWGYSWGYSWAGWPPDSWWMPGPWAVYPVVIGGAPWYWGPTYQVVYVYPQRRWGHSQARWPGPVRYKEAPRRRAASTESPRRARSATARDGQRAPRPGEEARGKRRRARPSDAVRRGAVTRGRAVRGGASVRGKVRGSREVASPRKQGVERDGLPSRKKPSVKRGSAGSASTREVGRIRAGTPSKVKRPPKVAPSSKGRSAFRRPPKASGGGKVKRSSPKNRGGAKVKRSAPKNRGGAKVKRSSPKNRGGTKVKRRTKSRE